MYIQFQVSEKSSIQSRTNTYKNLIVQCTRCQQDNCTESYCSLSFAYVKCENSHDTKTCKKSRDPLAMCEGGQPANYRVCEVYKKLQQN